MTEKFFQSVIWTILVWVGILAVTNLMFPLNSWINPSGWMCLLLAGYLGGQLYTGSAVVGVKSSLIPIILGSSIVGLVYLGQGFGFPEIGPFGYPGWGRIGIGIALIGTLICGVYAYRHRVYEYDWEE